MVEREEEEEINQPTAPGNSHYYYLLLLNIGLQHEGNPSSIYFTLLSFLYNLYIPPPWFRIECVIRMYMSVVWIVALGLGIPNSNSTYFVN